MAKQKTQNPPVEKYLAMRRHDDRRYRVWGANYFGDMFEIVPAEQIPTMREACRIIGVPVWFFHDSDYEIEDADLLIPGEALPA